MPVVAITLAQIDAALDAAWAAINVGELSFTVNNRTVTFHSLDAFARHIDWLQAQRDKLAGIRIINNKMEIIGLVHCPATFWRMLGGLNLTYQRYHKSLLTRLGRIL